MFREGEEWPKVTQKASECFASARPVPGEARQRPRGSQSAPEGLGFCSQGWRVWGTLNSAPQKHNVAAEMASALPDHPILMKLKGEWGPGWGQGRGYRSPWFLSGSFGEAFLLEDPLPHHPLIQAAPRNTEVCLWCSRKAANKEGTMLALTLGHYHTLRLIPP